MWAIKFCSNKILQFLTGGAGYHWLTCIIGIKIVCIKFSHILLQNKIYIYCFRVLLFISNKEQYLLDCFAAVIACITYATVYTVKFSYSVVQCHC